MNTASGVAFLLACVGLSLTACGGKKDSAPSASASAHAAAPTASAVKPAKPPASPTTDASADPAVADSATKPTPKGDPMFVGLTKEGPAVTLEKKVSLPSLGVEWSIPAAWVVDDYTTKLGTAKEDRKGCHPAAVTDATPYFDVVAPVIDAHKQEEWNGQDFPVPGQKPNGGPDNWEWAPYVGVALAKSQLVVVGTHRVEHPVVAAGEPSVGPYTHVWLFFRHPKTNKVGQVMLTWKSGDVASQTVLEGIAKSIAVP